MAFPADYTLLQSIDIDMSSLSLGGALTDYPYYINEDAIIANTWSNTDNGGGDVRFSSDESGDTQLPLEVVSFDNSGETCEMYTKIPSLGTGTTTIYLWGDNTGDSQPARTGTYGSDNVWGSSFIGVWHLETDGSDSSPSQYDLSANGTPVHAAAQIGDGADLEIGDSDFYEISDASGPNLDITGSQAWSCWIKPESFAGGFPHLMSKSPTDTHRLYTNSSGDYVRFNLSGLSDATVESSGAISTGTWYHVCGVYDSGNTLLKIFLNGTKTEDSSSGSATSTSDPFYLGSRDGRASTSNNDWDGFIDEARVYNGALTDDWVKVDYNTQNTPATYVTGSEVSTFTPKVVIF